MLFNSCSFVVFFVLLYAIYLRLRRHLRAQNLLLLAASYLFYGWWDWRFVGLLFLLTAVSFVSGARIAATEDLAVRRRWLTLAMGISFGVLAWFKYFDFFYDSLRSTLGLLGLGLEPLPWRVLLPVGISFFTFQAASYVIDVYRRDLEPATDLAEYALFVAFFPQLVAGPIERCDRLLPQIRQVRQITAECVDAGLWLLLWGYFKKLAVADNLAPLVEQVYGAPLEHLGLDLWLATIAFAVQIYCDFSGYTDIARGAAKLLGFDLMLNFRVPYAARNPSEFWARWHISLSTWFRDYVYIPLGGNRYGTKRTLLNLLLTMLVAGLWHGAAWTFVIWGLYHGLWLVAHRVIVTRLPAGRRGLWTSPAGGALCWTATLVLTLLGWVFFRATNLADALVILGGLGLAHTAATTDLWHLLLWYIWPVALIDAWLEWTGDLFTVLRLPSRTRGLVYTCLVLWLCIFAMRARSEFIYFQF